MTHSVSQRLAGDLRIPTSGIIPPVKADDTTHALFRSAVMDGLNARMQACSDNITRDALRQIADAFQQSKDIALPKSASGTDTDGMLDGKAVNRFITGLIQTRVHELDDRVSKRLHQSIPAEKACAALHLGMTQNRIAPLTAVYERAENGTILKTCLGEYMSAATAQCKTAEYTLFMAGLPDVIQTLSNQVDTLVAAKEDTDRERCIRFTDGLEAMVTAEVEANKEKIEELAHQNSAYNDQYADNLDIREEKIAALNKACEQNCADLESLIEQLEHRAVILALPPSLGAAAEAFLSEQSVLAGIREQLATAEKDATRSPELSRVASMLKDAQATSVHLMSTKTELTSHIKKLSQEADSRSRFDDFTLRIRRIFGGGRGQKTRADCNKEIQPLKVILGKVQGEQKQTAQEIERLKTIHAAELKATEQHKLQRAQHITTLKTQLSDTESRFDKSREGLKLAAESEIDSLKQNLVDESSAVMAAFYKQDEPMEEASSGRSGKIRLLEETNARLEKQLKGDLLNAENFRLLSDRLPHSPEFERLSRLLSEIENERSPECSDNVFIGDVRSLIHECRFTRDLFETTAQSDFQKLSKGTIDSLREKLESRGIDTQFRFDPETRQDLLQAGHLYARQSEEKIRSHPLAGAVSQAKALTPPTLVLLSSLEKEVKRVASTNKDIISAAALSRRNERMDRIDDLLAGIRRIVTQKHDKALSISADFNDQRYSESVNVYIDRQHNHGTCTMHSWNNLLAYISDNQILQMTPWRMEKLIQSDVVQSARQLVGEWLDDSRHHDLSLKSVEHMLEKIIRSSGLAHPGKLSHFVQHGHLMNYETNHAQVLHAEGNNLDPTSLRLFELMEVKGEDLFSMAYRFSQDDTDFIRKRDAISELISKQYDAYSLSIRTTGPDSAGHAIALIRAEDNFALIDSNYTEPVILSLPQLVDFICTGDSRSDGVNKKLTARHYDKYSAMYFNSGFYKEQRT